MGTSRGNGFGKFTWLEQLFGGGSGGKQETAGSRNFRRIFWAVIVIAIVLKIVLPADNRTLQEENTVSSGKIVADAVKAPSDMIAFHSGVSEIDQKIDSMYFGERKRLSNELLNAGLQESKTEKEKEEYKKKGGRNVGKLAMIFKSSAIKSRKAEIP